MSDKIKFIVGDLLNWYSQYVQGDIWYLNMFHDEMEISIQNSKQDFDKNKEWLPDDPNDPESGMHLFYRNMDGLTFDLEGIIKSSYPNLRRQSLLIVIMSTVEKRLAELCDNLSEKEKSKLNLMDINARGQLNKVIKYLTDVIELPLSEEFVFDWDKLVTIQSIRNDIVHELGKYSSFRDKKRSKKIRIISFVEQTPGININEGNEYVLDKSFLKFTLLLVDKIFMNLEKSIRDNYDEKYKLN